MARRRDYKAEYARRKAKYTEEYGVSYSTYRYHQKRLKEKGVTTEQYKHLVKTQNFSTVRKLNEWKSKARKNLKRGKDAPNIREYLDDAEVTAIITGINEGFLPESILFYH